MYSGFVRKAGPYRPAAVRKHFRDANDRVRDTAHAAIKARKATTGATKLAPGRGTPERLARARSVRSESQVRRDAAQVSRAYHEAAKETRGYQNLRPPTTDNIRVSVGAIREKLPHLSRERQDAAIMHLFANHRKGGSTNVYPADNPVELSARDRAAGINRATGLPLVYVAHSGRYRNPTRRNSS